MEIFVHSPQKALGQPSGAPTRFRTAVCNSRAALERQLNTNAREFREICENSKNILKYRRNYEVKKTVKTISGPTESIDLIFQTIKYKIQYLARLSLS
jgi:hypothetical protein